MALKMVLEANDQTRPIAVMLGPPITEATAVTHSRPA
jgi:hypothetical protein